MAQGADYTPGAFHNYTVESGDLPENAYPYSVFVPKDYDHDEAYPLVFFLHGGGKGRFHPNQGRGNMVAVTIRDNRRETDAGYSRNVPAFRGYILVSPVKPIAIWQPGRFERLYRHVKSKVHVDENRVYVTGFSMGGQGAWRVACGNPGGYRLAAMMPLGAWGCNQVPRGTTRETCKTIKTAVWVQHCPLDHVSKISEQLPLFHNHLKHGGYGRFTMIPGKGHISRGPNDRAFFSMRMAWMLSQTYGTPFNYIVRVQGGTIDKVETGDRPYTGDNRRYGFYEPGSVLRLGAPETRDGKPFRTWASLAGAFSEATSPRTTYTTVSGDVDVLAIYGEDTVTLRVKGGTSDPANPQPGDAVTVTADDPGTFAFWRSDHRSVVPAIPSSKTMSFVMPSTDVTLSAQSLRPNM
ncbi:MAG: hypothetical protein AAF492_09765 [Verrucomicrobiota bacterium]